MKKEPILQFLKQFKSKIKVFGIVYRDDRGKNTQTLADLEISPALRDKVIEGIELEDYCQGPVPDKLNKGSEMWVFGKLIKNKEIYIKVTMGIVNASAICISFHFAEQPLQYPFK